MVETASQAPLFLVFRSGTFRRCFECEQVIMVGLRGRRQAAFHDSSVMLRAHVDGKAAQGGWGFLPDFSLPCRGGGRPPAAVSLALMQPGEERTAWVAVENGQGVRHAKMLRWARMDPAGP